MDHAFRALNGFGMGARPGERGRISDPVRWLHAQIDGRVPSLAPPPEADPRAIADAIRAVRGAAQAGDAARRAARQRLTQIASAEARAAFAQRVTTDRPYVERLVAFWSNHLCVSGAGRFLVAPLAGSYERDVIRPHVLGRFEDMVLASARHPAMLLYLDNAQSVGPNSRGVRAAGRGGAARGLNENYARELLELHTLGVDGGYTQDDVTELARILTGWTVNGLAGPGAMQTPRGRGRLGQPPAPPDGALGFAFRPLVHEPGARTVLGTRYTDGDVRDGERVIRTLCRHASTARFVATKLVTHFVADDPPAPAVDHITRTFQESGGDLRAVAHALIDLPDAWSTTARKFRTPHDWLVASCRAVGLRDVPPAFVPLLGQLRQPLWAPPSPKGYGDRMREWADPDALLNRAELARTIARRFARDTRDVSTIVDVVELTTGDPLRGLAADVSIEMGERLALVLAGPAFQWR